MGRERGEFWTLRFWFIFYLFILLLSYFGGESSRDNGDVSAFMANSDGFDWIPQSMRDGGHKGSKTRKFSQLEKAEFHTNN
jgi:hypothetical protein